MSDALDLWFEEELSPSEAVLTDCAKSLALSADFTQNEAEREVRVVAKGVLRVDRPRWTLLDPADHKLLASGDCGDFYFVRLGFQFDLTEEARRENSRFTYARCEAYLWPAGGIAQPSVYELVPRDLYEGESRKVHVELGPQIKLGEVGGSLGKISSDFAVGRVEPVVVGFPGENERAPYWDLRPKSKSLLGARHLWLIIEAPKGCDGVRLAVTAHADIQTHWGRIPVGPKSETRASRPSMVIKS